MAGFDKERDSRPLREAIDAADAIVVGAGAGLSTAAGSVYAGERFERLFPDFIEKYGFGDMYSAGFYPYQTLEEFWAYWSRYIWHNRYEPAPKDTYDKLLRLLSGKDFFVITTNVDHQFQLAGFPKERLFYTQGDYGLWQCSTPCHDETYDNYGVVKRMVEDGRDCSEVLIQLSAIESAIKSVSRVILKEHMSTCIIDAVRKDDLETIEELNKAIDKFIR